MLRIHNVSSSKCSRPANQASTISLFFPIKAVFKGNPRPVVRFPFPPRIAHLCRPWALIAPNWGVPWVPDTATKSSCSLFFPLASPNSNQLRCPGFLTSKRYPRISWRQCTTDRCQVRWPLFHATNLKDLFGVHFFRRGRREKL